MDWISIIERAKGMAIQPRETWGKIRQEETTSIELIMHTIAPMAAVPAAAHLLGFWIILGFFKTIFTAILWYVLTVAGVWLLGKIIYYLSAQFGVEPDEARSFQLSATSFTPFILAGIFYIVPNFTFIVFLSGLYGIYALSLGLPILLDIPEEKTASFQITAGGVLFLLIILIGRLTGGVLAPHKPFS